jgi:hypothetical protein
MEISGQSSVLLRQHFVLGSLGSLATTSDAKGRSMVLDIKKHGT